MAADERKEIYKQRAATSDTVNADLRTYRGLSQITVRGLQKAKCVALWCALAYNPDALRPRSAELKHTRAPKTDPKTDP